MEQHGEELSYNDYKLLRGKCLKNFALEGNNQFWQRHQCRYQNNTTFHVLSHAHDVRYSVKLLRYC